MSDTANSGPLAPGHRPPAPEKPLAPRLITATVITLCLIACALTFLLPADSLIVDLVYQGF